MASQISPSPFGGAEATRIETLLDGSLGHGVTDDSVSDQGTIEFMDNPPPASCCAGGDMQVSGWCPSHHPEGTGPW